MESLLPYFFGSFLLSVVHAIIPNHWLPLIALGRSEKWSVKETLGITAITGMAHTFSTILLGILVGLIGFKLTHEFEEITHIVAPSVLVLLGLFYLVKDLLSKKHHHHDHFHVDKIEPTKRKNKKALIASLSFAMFFSPCIEIEAYYLQASAQGWAGILLVSINYFVVTVGGMVLLVFLGQKGLEKMNWHFLEHHEKLLTGIVLILVGIFAFFGHHE